MNLCFGFRRTMFITHFSCCWAVLRRAKVISASCTALPVRGLEQYRELGGDRTRTADLNWPKDIPYHMASCRKKKTLKNLQELARQAAAAWEQAGHWSAGGKRLLAHHLVCKYVYKHSTYLSIYLPLFLSSIFVSSSYLNLWVLTFFSDSPPSHWERGSCE